MNFVPGVVRYYWTSIAKTNDVCRRALNFCVYFVQQKVSDARH
jgi:hypothetical protein